MLHILQLPQKKQTQAMYEYNENKYNKPNWYICRWFGLYRLYTKQYELFVLFIITLFFGIGLIRWFIDAFQVSSFVDKKNRELDELLYNKYK